MDLSLVLVFVFVFLVSIWFTRKRQNLPPGPRTVPWLGSIGLMQKLRKSKKRPHEVFFEESKRYGDIWCFFIGKQPYIVLNGYDIIHEAIALRDFGVGKTSIEEKVAAEVDELTRVIQGWEGRPGKLNPELQNVVANVILGIVFGKRYDYDDPEFADVQQLTNTVVSGSGPISTTNVFPRFIARLFNKKEDVIMNKRREAFQQMGDYIMSQIKEHESSFDENSIRDFVDIYLRSQKHGSEDERKHITMGNMFRVIFDLFLAGSETTYATLDWAFLQMIRNPEVQTRCQEEIAQVIGERAVKYADKDKLTYVNATIMEIHRMGNIVPLNVAHRATEAATLGCYDIPKNAIILPSIYSASMDSRKWSQPETFNPDRFLSENKKLQKEDSLIPFSVGPRTCLGEPLARMELFLVFTNLLQRFTFSPERQGALPSLEARPNQITNMPSAYSLVARPRS
ncbi:CP2J5-like protein [Mya arenaria]|uniref:CP2J5-like protein n=1 Tax=Mya arenaria TaxID=6604 RepID=A0ABY7DLX8_MYAAR|nr:CP2J5-like protein [Mya arenaria]